MSSTGEQMPPAYAQPAPAGPAYVSSVIALVFGAVLAIGVSVMFGLLGWGGELASQVAGAASGAAPLILDGLRQRRSRTKVRPGPRAPRVDLLRRYNKLWVASVFGFAVMLLEAALGLLVWRMTEWSIRLADGDLARFTSVYGLLGSVITLPVACAGTYLLAVAAGHRLGERTRRWILLGMGIHFAIRSGMIIFGGSPSRMNLLEFRGLLISGLVLSTALMVWAALLGARRARKTQAAYYAQLYFRRLSPADQEAALVLLDETVMHSPPPSATPPAAAPSSAAGSPAPPPPAPR